MGYDDKSKAYIATTLLHKKSRLIKMWFSMNNL